MFHIFEMYKQIDDFKIDGIPLVTCRFVICIVQDSSVIDTEAISEVCDKFGVKEHEVHAALLSGDPHDQLAIAYHLVIDNKRIADEAAKAEIKDFYVASELA